MTTPEQKKDVTTLKSRMMQLLKGKFDSSVIYDVVDYINETQEELEMQTREINALIQDNDLKCEKLEEMKHKIKGLEQTLSNYKEKEQKRYDAIR